jgi:broad specificity phosphatase PhoE
MSFSLILGMKLILVRHGETEWNQQHRVQGSIDVPLNRKGLEQARKVAMRLKNEPIDMIYCSSMRRARQTAAEIVKFHDAPVSYSGFIREKSFGKTEGMSSGEYRKLREGSGLPYHLFRPHGGENYADVSKRVRKFLALLKRSHGKETVLIVSHGGIIRTIITIMCKKPLENIMELEQHNTAVSVIELNPGRKPKVHYLNSTEHL